MDDDRPTSVEVPEYLETIFRSAEARVSRFFERRREDVTTGTIEIFGERYVLVRAGAMSVEFIEAVREFYDERDEEDAHTLSRSLLFDVAHAMGIADARSFAERMDLDDPVARLSAGPVHFAHTGWARVEIDERSRPTPDERFLLHYEHPNSFEAEAWLDSEREASRPVCTMSAGYSSGWCQESFGMELVAAEITCRARGDDACRFVMAPPERIAGRIEEFFELEPELAERVGPFEIPDFFAREHAAEELRRSRDELAERVAARTEALRRTNRSLQQEVRERRQAERRLRELNEELRVARDRALEASRARSAFLMRMSHELRTPLSAVIGYSELLAEEIGEGDIAARREALVEDLHKIRGASRGLLTMIDEILELTSLYDSSPSVSLEVSGARAIASEVVDQKQASAREHDNTLRLVCRDDPGDLRVDRGRLVGALAHLVDNACRFTRGGDIEVEVLRRRERGEDWIEFTVRDEGIGIDPGRLDEIFEPFSQEDAASAQREGSVGLGLPLARHLVEGMGGAIEARSEPGRGSAFTVSMPVRIEE